MAGGIQWAQMPWEPVKDGVERRMVIGGRVMMVMYHFGPRQAWPEEVHEAEQGGYVIAGSIELTLPASGTTTVLRGGDGYLIPSMVPHSWRTLDEEVQLVDIFSPPRTELVEQKFAPNAR